MSKKAKLDLFQQIVQISNQTDAVDASEGSAKEFDSEKHEIVGELPAHLQHLYLFRRTLKEDYQNIVATNMVEPEQVGVGFAGLFEAMFAIAGTSPELQQAQDRYDVVNNLYFTSIGDQFPLKKGFKGWGVVDGWQVVHIRVSTSHSSEGRSPGKDCLTCPGREMCPIRVF